MTKGAFLCPACRNPFDESALLAGLINEWYAAALCRDCVSEYLDGHEHRVRLRLIASIEDDIGNRK